MRKLKRYDEMKSEIAAISQNQGGASRPQSLNRNQGRQICQA